MRALVQNPNGRGSTRDSVLDFCVRSGLVLKDLPEYQEARRRVLGEMEEYFFTTLTRGDTFLYFYPYWQAAVRRETLDHPAAAAAIEDECAKCHMPMAHLTAHVAGGRGEIFAHLPVG